MLSGPRVVKLQGARRRAGRPRRNFTDRGSRVDNALARFDPDVFDADGFSLMKHGAPNFYTDAERTAARARKLRCDFLSLSLSTSRRESPRNALPRRLRCAPFEWLLSASLRSERNCAKASSRLLISGLVADWKQKRKGYTCTCVLCESVCDVCVDETATSHTFGKRGLRRSFRKTLKINFPP